METLQHADLFATKGMEYLLVISYLVLLTVFWNLLRQPAEAAAPGRRASRRASGAGGWFRLPEELFFHRGHTWAMKERKGLVRVGMDEFSRKLLGSPSSLTLPAAGTRLEQGLTGWSVEVGGARIPMLSPVTGEVLEVNPRALEAPEEVLNSPYEEGWLLKVRVDPTRCPLKNLLQGEVAQAWVRAVEERIRSIHAGELGLVLPDGGEPMDGMARILADEKWDDLAREFLLLGDPC